MSLNNSELRSAQVGSLWAASTELGLSFCAWVAHLPHVWWALLFTMGVFNLVMLGCLVLMRGYMPGRGELERVVDFYEQALREAGSFDSRGHDTLVRREPGGHYRCVRATLIQEAWGRPTLRETWGRPVAPRAAKRLPRRVKGLGLAVLFLLAAQGWADAVVMPTDRITGFMLGPSLLVQAAGYSFASNGDLTPSAEVIAGGQMGVYLGTYGLSKDDAIQFDPTFYVIPLGLGFGSEYGHTHLVYTCALGYRGFGLTTSWNLGTGEPPLVGVEANITLVDLVQGMDYAFGYDRHFPSGHWSQ